MGPVPTLWSPARYVLTSQHCDSCSTVTYTRADTDHTTVDPAIAAIKSSCAVCAGPKTPRFIHFLLLLTICPDGH